MKWAPLDRAAAGAVDRCTAVSTKVCKKWFSRSQTLPRFFVRQLDSLYKMEPKTVQAYLIILTAICIVLPLTVYLTIQLVRNWDSPLIVKRRRPVVVALFLMIIYFTVIEAPSYAVEYLQGHNHVRSRSKREHPLSARRRNLAFDSGLVLRSSPREHTLDALNFGVLSFRSLR